MEPLKSRAAVILAQQPAFKSLVSIVDGPDLSNATGDSFGSGLDGIVATAANGYPAEGAAGLGRIDQIGPVGTSGGGAPVERTVTNTLHFGSGDLPNPGAMQDQPGNPQPALAALLQAGATGGLAEGVNSETGYAGSAAAGSRTSAVAAVSGGTPADDTTLIIAPGATLDIAAPLSPATAAIDFGATTSTQTLIIGAAASGGQGGAFAPALTDFGGSDRIEVLGVAATDPVTRLEGSALTITDGANGPVVYTLAHVPTDVSYAASALPGGGLLVTDPPTSVVPAYSHIVVVMEENHNFDEIIGNNAEAPFLNSLADSGAILSNYHAITHPSQPNYFAIYAGSTFGTTDDNTYSEPDPTLATILQGAGDTFTGFVDESDSDINHNPWESFPEGRSVQTDFGPTTSYPTFSSMFPSGNYSSLPSVSFVIPGIYNDMHSGTILQGDAWLQANLGAYAQWAQNNNSLLIVTWDENDDESTNPTEATNQVPAILYGAGVVPGEYDGASNHYNTLSTILAAFGLTGPNNAATAAPINVFAGDTVAAHTTGPLALTAADNPLVITSSGAIASTAAGKDAIDGPAGTAWAIANNGSVSSATALGISLADGGSVSNGSSNAAAVISGKLNGVAIYGAAGNVINSGHITATVYDGVILAGSVTSFVYGYAAGTSNRVTNAAGAAISGGTNGVYITAGTAGTVTNAGSIGASAGAGVDLGGGGVVANAAGGSISGNQFGVVVTGAAGTIANYGSISGTIYEGVALAKGGGLTNYAGGSITGPTGVYFRSQAPGSVINSGRITGTASNALAMTDGGSVSNAAGAVMSGAATGVLLSGGAGTITNNGTISGGVTAGYGLVLGDGGSVSNAGSINGRDGLGLRAGGTLLNEAGGSISGLGTSGTGVFVGGAAGAITNQGNIAGNHLGVLVVSGGDLTNAAAASIRGATAGVFSNGVSETVVNYGSISATSGAALDIEAGGNVANEAGGVISGSGFGVFVTGAGGAVVNSGSIAGGANIGILFEAGGSVTNHAAASISGGTAGFFSNNVSATLTNSGTITATAAGGAGADIEGGGSIANNATASIAGNGFGVFVTGGAGSITNSGAIAGATADGVVLSVGGSVTNNSGASISGASNGVYVKYGTAGTITNSGNIAATGAGGAGIDLAGSGRITNGAGGSISGGSFGVFLEGGAGTLSNAGTISGGSYSVLMGTNAADRLVVAPGAVFEGAVAGGGGTLELTGGTGAIGGIDNGAFLHFQSLAIDSGASWTLNGANPIAGVIDNGALTIAGSLDVSSAVDPSSSGTFRLDGGATLEVAAATGTRTQINFLAASQLIIDSAASFGAGIGTSAYAGPQLQDFTAGDSVDVKNFGPGGVTLGFTAATGVLQLANTAGQAASLQFQTASLGSGSFHTTGDGAAGILITHS